MSAGIEWGDPPSPPRAPAQSAQGEGKWASTADALRLRPKEWAVVATKANPHLAADTANNIRRGVLASMPKGEFEATARTVGSECRVYARYIGGSES